jgi:hypothetical protein
MILLPIDLNIQGVPQGEVGWFNSHSENSLNLMAEQVGKKILALEEEVVERDHAIPSPAAHLMNYRKKLLSFDSVTQNTWRGLLAVIALRDNYGFDIKMQFKDLSSHLGQVLKESLEENCDWPINTSSIPVFTKDGHPFAFAAPGVLICPFKSYPKDLFQGVDWYDEISGVWRNPLASLINNDGSLSVQGKKLSYWLEQLDDYVPQNSKFRPLFELYFKEAINGYALNDEERNKYANDAQDTAFGQLNAGEKQIVQELNIEVITRAARAPSGALKSEEMFSDKLLIYVPSNMAYKYPFKFMINKDQANIFRYEPDAELKAYVIPPVSDKFAELIKENARICIQSITYPKEDCLLFTSTDKTADKLKLTCIVEIEFKDEGQTIKYMKTFENRNIVWTDKIPYMLLWPNVNIPNGKWNSYYLAVLQHNIKSKVDLSKFDYSFKKLNKLDENEGPLKITAKPRYDGVATCYNVRSRYNPLNPEDDSVKFKMYHSHSMIDAVGLSYENAKINYNLGYLWIEHSEGDTYSIDPVELYPDDEYIVGVDFGTTSTNVYLALNNQDEGNNSLTSIVSPGKYSLELTKTDDYIDKVINDSYLFTSEDDLLNKIFTAGQLFHANKEDEHSPTYNIDFISGRFIEIDREDFWRESYDRKDAENQINDFSNWDIYFRLKFPQDEASQAERKTRVSNLFIQSLLQTALLECRLKGGSKVIVRYAYPFRNKNPFYHWNDAIKETTQKFSANKNDISVRQESVTESVAAATYFYRKCPGDQKPIGEQGYAIVDIGGGTTDISVWKNHIGKNASNQLRGDHSFKYAGQLLVNRTLIQTIFGYDDFLPYLRLEGKNDHIFKMYDGLHRKIERPLPDRFSDPILSSAISIFDILLENDCFINEQISTNHDFRIFLKLKYMSLFYLIAKFIKAIGNQTENMGNLFNNNPGRFTIHLAGCGAKGLQYCTGRHDIRKLDTSDYGKLLISMIRELLSLESNYEMYIFAPLSSKKEEVVQGLMWLDNVDINNDDETEENNDTEVGVDDFEYDAIRNEYINFIEILLKNSGTETSLKQVLKTFSLNDNKKIMEKIFINYFGSIKDRVLNSNPQKDLVGAYFCLLFIDELSNKYFGEREAFRARR